MSGCSLQQFRARIGGYSGVAVKLSTHKLYFMNIRNVNSCLVLLLYGSRGLSLALLLFLILNDASFSHHLSRRSRCCNNGLKNKTNFSNVLVSTLMFVNMLFCFICLCLLLLCGDVEPNPGPVLDREQGISIVHINVRSLKNKIFHLQAELGRFDIITVSETWLSTDVDNEDINLNGFHPPIRCDRPGDAHGGVAVYVKSDLICKPRYDLSIPSLEAVWVETKIDQETLLVGTFYRPPDANVNYWDLIDESIQSASRTPQKLIILGDFNADCMNNPPPHLQRLLNVNSLFQIVTEPTRITEHSSTLIDLILTPCPDMIDAVDIFPPVCSDHSCPYVKIKKTVNLKRSFKRTIYNYSKLNIGKFVDDLLNLDWPEVVNLEPLDAAVESFTDILMTTAKHCMPVKTVVINERDAPWITEGIKKLIRKKQIIHSLAKRLDSMWCWALFRRIRNILVDKIRKRKEEYDIELDDRINSQIHFGNKDWWKLVNKFMTKKGLSQSEIPPIDNNGIICYSDEEKAEVFNTFFVNQSCVDDEDDPFPTLSEHPGSAPPLIITTDMVSGIIKSLDQNKAVGPDLVHNKILKAAVDVVSDPLSKLFSRSLAEGKFPKAWKVAHVTPVYKKGEKSLCTNYRPISLLSCIGKVMEKCIQTHMFTYLTDHNLLTVSQSGFIPGDSTVFQLLGIYDDLCQSLDKQCTSQAIFFDISKAFDRVWHRGLIYKLYAIGIRDMLLEWIKDYLSDRTQAVVIKGCMSNYRCVHSGVPQGSVLGPLLFLVYINDIVVDIKSIIKLFADDTSMYVSLDNTLERTEILNSDAQQIMQWAKNWKVNFNQSKTELLTVSTRRQPETLPLKFGEEILIETTVHKHLGVYLQNDCKWNHHVHSIVVKARILVACLRSYKYRLSRKALEMMYKAFILPHFDYADVIWDNCNAMLAVELEKMHLDAIRTIIGAVRGTSHQKLYNESGFTTLQERRRKHKLIVYFKLVNGLAPVYLLDYLPSLISAVNPYHRRKPYDRQMFRCRTELYKHSFFPSATSLWNELPDHIKQTNSIGCFKRFLSRDDPLIPPYVYSKVRKAEIIHCKLRLEISDLNADMFKRHLTNDVFCRCGFHVENCEHFLFDCPLYTNVRATTIDTLPDNNNITVLCAMYGNSDKSLAENTALFYQIQKFILDSKRFC